MIRMQGAPQIDPEEEKNKAKRSVIENIGFFVTTIAIIRVGK